MNIAKSILTILFASLLFTSCKEKLTETDPEIAEVKKEIAAENLQTASFTIHGMTCAIGCAKTIQEELNGLDGVQTATVDFKETTATVTFDKTILNAEKITKIVEATADGKSYKVSNIKF